MQNKAQASMEYLFIFAIGLTIIGILTGIFISYTNSAKNNLDFKQLNKIGNDLILNSEKIFFLGDGNRITINAIFPEGIENLSIHHINESGDDYDYINFTLTADGVEKYLVFQTIEDYVSIDCSRCYNKTISSNESVSWFNTSDFGPGPKSLRVESTGGKVLIDFVIE